MLSGLVNEDAGQQKPMETVDRYNAKAGEGKIKLASEGLTKPWFINRRINRSGIRRIGGGVGSKRLTGLGK